jgi:hypothetical protein
VYQIDSAVGSENFTQFSEPFTDPYELLFGPQSGVGLLGELKAEEFISDTGVTNRVIIRRTTVRPSYGRSIRRDDSEAPELEQDSL